MQKQGRNSQEKIVQPWGRVLVPPQGMCLTIPLSYSAGNKAPTQVEDGDFRLNTRFLDHHPVTSPPTNQKKVTTLQPSPQILPIKTSPRKPSESSGYLSTSHLFTLLGPAINLFLLQTLTFWFGLTEHGAHKLAFGNTTTNLLSVSIDLLVLDVSYKWNYTIYGLL